jgi:hypothetical protein
MATAMRTRRHSETDRAKLLTLTKGADRVELELTVPMSERSRAGRGSG